MGPRPPLVRLVPGSAVRIASPFAMAWKVSSSLMGTWTPKQGLALKKWAVFRSPAKKLITVGLNGHPTTKPTKSD